jgi:hypothetical protein
MKTSRSLSRNSLIVKYTFSGTLHGISSITEIKDFLSHLSRSVSLAAVRKKISGSRLKFSSTGRSTTPCESIIFDLD